MTAETTTDRGVRVAGLTKVFGEGDSAVHALKGIDLEISSGEMIVVLGPSGSGKTTLCNIIGGIETSTDGKVEVAGVDISDVAPARLSDFRRDHVGFIFQFFNLIPTLTARENVEVIIEMTGRGDKTQVPKVLEAVGLGDRMDSFPSQLSGGQQQRVAVARALATDPDILFADEPTGALDLPTGQQILGLLQDLHRQGRTIIAVTHNASVAQIADRVITLVDGRIDSIQVNDSPADAADVTW
ncbi:ABC transporter ATP-binding protein [Demequina zhanjiangensis]|uniref:ABC transporter ATP-binding protein n=1 Tax=Demequina zhanjiangensis TaxID=3051659 RepID=A0ABT8FZD2_9MICO|nr:ABC transporter ATP-binding protein [Demequina sp. SYSU T00b26]MDN4472251.1 ABC transporter ATP-binding protein [Demequina sp. SYSU T00b26]